MAGLEGAPLAPSLCAWPLGPRVAGQEGALAEPNLLWGGAGMTFLSVLPSFWHLLAFPPSSSFPGMCGQLLVAILRCDIMGAFREEAGRVAIPVAATGGSWPPGR